MRRRGTMIRALSLTCLAAALLAPASALAKPSICVLGLEVKDSPGGSITQEDTKIASELTGGLRGRSKTGGPYQWAGAASDKDLIDQKLVTGCDNEGEQCMSAIGAQLQCDFLMYGSIRRDKNPPSYIVSLHLLNVKTQVKDKHTTDKVPLSDATNQA